MSASYQDWLRQSQAMQAADKARTARAEAEKTCRHQAGRGRQAEAQLQGPARTGDAARTHPGPGRGDGRVQAALADPALYRNRPTGSGS